MLLLFGFLICVRPLVAQQEGSPKRELRGVYVTTSNSLDWPKTTNKLEQQASLRKIIRDMKAANFNAMFFQIRARGDSYYNSGFEPWAENLTGTLGKNPGWDPLQFVLDEAHAAGIEVHAWFNVYKIRGPNPPQSSSPQHPVRAFPNWVVKYADEWWFDPGLPEVRAHLLKLVLDVVKKYDIDGLCYDFIRYPGRDFPDGETYRRYGNGAPLLDWRRENINRFVAQAYDAIIKIKPMVKIGAAPVGNYGGTMSAQPDTKNAAGGFADYAQDARAWISAGTLDYFAPQVYWTLEFNTEGPDFAHIARAWQKSSAGRHTYISIGPYKPEIFVQVPDQITSSRLMNTQGQVYFRYENIAAMNMFAARYAKPAFLPLMSWKDSIPPLAPRDLEVIQRNARVRHIRWKKPLQAADGDTARYFAVYRWRSEEIDLENLESVYAITTATAIIDTLDWARSFFYAVTAFDKGNNESAPTVSVIRKTK